MATTTEITNISHLLDFDAWFGDHADDYDADAVFADFVAALNEAAGDGIYVTRSGIVYADLDQTERAAAVDWDELADGIDTDTIAERHDLTDDAPHDLSATYTETGDIKVTGTYTDGSELRDHLGTYDADGGEWREQVEARLAAAGYTIVGEWTEDADFNSHVPVTTR